MAVPTYDTISAAADEELIRHVAETGTLRRFIKTRPVPGVFRSTMPGPAQQTTTAVLRAVVTMALADVVAEGPMATQLNAVMSELVQAHVEAVLLETRGLALPPPVRNSGFGL